MDLVKTEESKLANIDLVSMIDDVPVDAKDYLIPSLLLMQSTSDLVKKELARTGEIRDSVSQAKIMERGKSMEFLAFSVFKSWITLTQKGSKYIRQVPYTAENCMWPRETTFDGVDVVNYETLNYYVLLPDEIKSGLYVPYLLSFRSTNYRAGKALETARAKLQEFKKPLAFKVFSLSAQPAENDKGSWFMYQVQESRNATDQELLAAKKWFDIVKSGKTRVDESAYSESDVSHTVTESDKF